MDTKNQLQPSNEIVDGTDLDNIVKSNQTSQANKNRLFVIFITRDGKKHETLIKEIYHEDKAKSVIRFVADVYSNQNHNTAVEGVYDYQSKKGSIFFYRFKP